MSKNRQKISKTDKNVKNLKKTIAKNVEKQSKWLKKPTKMSKNRRKT